MVELIYAASEGRIRDIQRLVARGADLDQGDYDLRTPLHLAAAEGGLLIVDRYDNVRRVTAIVDELVD